MKYDFSGWATRNNLRCSDGRIIRKDAFKHDDGQTVPLVWNHQHNSPDNVLGHALLENRDEGVYAYCTFNETPLGQQSKLLVQHGDITALSIYANQLKQMGSDVLHGAIREVSIVLAGANPGAYIESVISHGSESEEEAVIYTGEDIKLYHAEDNSGKDKGEKMSKENSKKKNGGKTIGDVFNTLTEEQKTVVYALVGQALQEQKSGGNDEDEEDEEEMKHNVFDSGTAQQTDVLSHSEMAAIFADAKRYGSLKDSIIAHGIEDIDFLFPDARNVTQTPQFIERERTWVPKVMNGTHHTPFSIIKLRTLRQTKQEQRVIQRATRRLRKYSVFLREPQPPQPFTRSRSLTETT
ncbi:MAG: HK97 family phage prohead protease [Eubacterium sp.]|nr:HK97 family phage prohead protease [Eubacterium sp.]